MNVNNTAGLRICILNIWRGETLSKFEDRVNEYIQSISDCTVHDIKVSTESIGKSLSTVYTIIYEEPHE